MLQLDAGRFAVELPLAYGANALRIVAVDGGGNRGEAQVNVSRAVPLAPTAQLTTPANNSVVSTNKITVAGSVYSSQAADQLRVTLGTVSLFPTATTSAGIYRFSFDNVVLNAGLNTLTVSVASPAGSTSASLNVSYKSASTQTSAAAPAIALTYPANTDDCVGARMATQ